ncbi:hypothetical protein GF1_29960 [Desulfolithobacter dissulfuricans]|uniref:Uncharacterized protein n=1 Tax=Desulfolithobacter dissulfuricans TaxID=2795293 RepID=A0A915U449_9BACT|nr:hypothetical protein [Desulfolithobacter dissulfuricans]BCO10620.1 hypothetical protein GF1_29960 [Desulfolithobacter dissulfuricans]
MIEELMIEFARRTGLSPATEQPRRYLWTDAFAVCNFLGLHDQTGERKYLDLALALVDQVHHTLGRHRPDDARKGWISGLGEAEGEHHPTIGGLRIGKKMNERAPGDPFDEALEWKRDGQYFHYLTKWMHALNRLSRVTGDPTYNRWAVEMARAVHARFTYLPPSGGPRRMYWKMSIDLSRPLVPSMGQHDPLDGYITYNQLQLCLPEGETDPAAVDLGNEIRELAEICRDRNWATDDALGIGGLLTDGWKLAQMMIQCGFNQPGLLTTIVDSAAAGLHAFVLTEPLRLPAPYRLPFREFGLAIGLRAMERLHRSTCQQPEQYESHGRLPEVVGRLRGYQSLAGEIEAFWLDPLNREAATWKEHLDINAVMLATSLAPDGFLSL